MWHAAHLQECVQLDDEAKNGMHMGICTQALKHAQLQAPWPPLQLQMLHVAYLLSHCPHLPPVLHM